jgi:hypothetical protein
LEGKKDPRGKVPGKAKTIKEPVTEKIWEAHLTGKEGLGIVPVDDEGFTKFGAIDVDVYDLNLENLESRVRKTKMPLTVCRTKSGGAHLYLFMKDPTPASFVREKLMEWAVFLGYPQVEVFPKQSELGGEDDIGSWINMPYFGGDRTTRYAVVEGKNLSTLEFLDYADGVATLAPDIEALTIEQDEELVGGPPCLQHLAKSGFPDGARNQGLFDLGVFCKMKFGDKWKDKTREFNQKYLIPPLEKQETETIIKSVDKKSYFYRCKESPIASVCNRSICSRREYGVNRSGNDPGITMDGMAKILTDPPMWMMNVNGRRIKLSSADDFLLQNRFTRVCVDSYNIVPNRVNENVWRDLVRTLLDKVEEIEAPADTGLKGEFFALLEKYCSERSMARYQDELLTGKPWQDGDWVMFRSTDMLEWMKKKKFNIGSREAWNFLRDKKARSREFTLKGKHIRVWIIPAFTQQTEPLDVPDMSEKKSEF